jgi:RNase P/RNase MRP subunit p29
VASPNAPQSAPPTPAAPLKNIEQLMAEADPVQTLRQTGNLRVLGPLIAGPDAPKPPKTGIPESISKLPESSSPAAPAAKVTAATLPSTPPPFVPSNITPPAEVKKPDPTLESPGKTSVASPSTGAVQGGDETDSPFILKPAAKADVAKVIPPSAPSLLPFGSIFRRKAKMTDVARIVLPPKREESDAPDVPTEPSPTVVPPAFPVAAMTARAHQPPSASQPLLKVSSPAPAVTTGEKAPAEPKAAEVTSAASPTNDVPPEKNPTEASPSGSAAEKAVSRTPERDPSAGKIVDLKAKPDAPAKPDDETKLVAPVLASIDVPKLDPEAHQPEPSSTPVPKLDPEAPKLDVLPAPSAKLDPEAHKKPESSSTPAPKIDPEAHKPTESLPSPATLVPAPEAPKREKREFHLANGERVAGVVLSETPEAVYIEHSTLGVLTLPRTNIAKRLIEIILINGDRIVGDIMAETADTLYVRHASLGMLTVPRAQRSTRVVEAILKDGDRILGEVLTETDKFTVIRSASLGTITVPHSNIAMLNRKIEQIELKALPPPAAEIKDKPAQARAPV